MRQIIPLRKPAVNMDRIMRSIPHCHYAFVVLMVATLGKVFTSPGQSPCIGVIIEDVRLDVNVTRSTLTGYYFAATTTSAILLPVGGRLIDHFGPRIMVSIFASGLGLACFVISWVQKPGGVHLFLALFMLRFFGQGNLMNVSITEINYWWVERRGFVMGIAGGVVSATMLGIIPIIMLALIESHGWRQTYVILGVTTITFMAPLGLLFFRGKPEQYGLLPDAKHVNAGSSPAIGLELAIAASSDSEEEIDVLEEEHYTPHGQATSTGATAGATAADTANTLPTNKVDEVNWTAKEVFRSRAFYVFAVADLIIAGTGTAFWFHLRSAFKESGVSDAVLSTIYPTLAVVSVVGRLFSGWLIDRISQRHVMWIGLVMQSLGLALVPVMTTDVLAYAVALLIGASGSFCSNVRATVYAEYYGRKHLGSVQSVASSLTVFGSAIGPFPFGVARDQTGSYALPFGVASLFPLVAAFAVFFLGQRGVRLAHVVTPQGFRSVLNENLDADDAMMNDDVGDTVEEQDDLIDEI